MTMEEVLLNAADITHVQLLSKVHMLQENTWLWCGHFTNNMYCFLVILRFFILDCILITLHQLLGNFWNNHF